MYLYYLLKVASLWKCSYLEFKTCQNKSYCLLVIVASAISRLFPANVVKTKRAGNGIQDEWWNHSCRRAADSVMDLRLVRDYNWPYE